MHRVHSIVAILLLASLGIQATDYCHVGTCGSKHIGCNNTGEFSPNCKEPTLVDMKPLIPMILHLHNEMRDEVAGGMTNLRPAVHMATMQWDDELAALALLNAKRCQVKHDDCRNTERFRLVGQNLAAVDYNGEHCQYSDSHIVKARIESWLSESVNCPMESIRNVTYPTEGYGVSRFLITVIENNTHVGCGAIQQKIGARHELYIVCNYSANIEVNKEVYEDGDKGGTRCTTGTHPIYRFLCSLHEMYN